MFKYKLFIIYSLQKTKKKLKTKHMINPKVHIYY